MIYFTKVVKVRVRLIMARPKPTEEMDQINVRGPKSTLEKIQELADQSNDGMGVSKNQWCFAIIEEAVRLGITVTPKTGFTLDNPGGIFREEKETISTVSREAPHSATSRAPR